MVAVQVLVIGGAGNQRALCLTQRLLPGVRIRASAGIVMTLLETGGEKIV
jgi:hypothetical protein